MVNYEGNDYRKNDYPNNDYENNNDSKEDSTLIWKLLTLFLTLIVVGYLSYEYFYKPLISVELISNYNEELFLEEYNSNIQEGVISKLKIEVSGEDRKAVITINNEDYEFGINAEDQLGVYDTSEFRDSVFKTPLSQYTTKLSVGDKVEFISIEEGKEYNFNARKVKVKPINILVKVEKLSGSGILEVENK